MVKEPLIWTWNGQKTDIRNLDQRQLYSIKETLTRSNDDWFGNSKETWIQAIDPILKQHEHMNINHIVHQQNSRRTASANGIADKIIQMFTKKNGYATNNNIKRQIKTNH
jgi:hypothetical protein